MTEESVQMIYDMSADRIRETETSFHRYLFDEIDWDSRVVALDGPRGVGKTTMLLQHLRENRNESDTALYVSVDNVWLNAQELYELAQHHVRHGGESIYIDEIHYLADWQNLIKTLYDNFKTLKIAYTGSSILRLAQGKADLSRRQVEYSLAGMSFREFLEFEGCGRFPVQKLGDILKNHVSIAEAVVSTVKVVPKFEQYLEHGYYPFYREDLRHFHGASATMGSGGLNLIGSNVWLVVEGGSSFGSRVGNCTKDGGIRLDDGTVSGTFFRTDYNWDATTNEWYVFSGAAPRLTATQSFRNDSTDEKNLQNADTTFLFSVPRNGWSAAPLYAEYSSSEKFGGMLGTGEGGYVIAIDPESPAFTAAGTRTTQLIEWCSGIDTTHVRFADNIPAAATLSWTYGWPSTLDAPENEGDAPTGVKATIVGRAKRSMILVW